MSIFSVRHCSRLYKSRFKNIQGAKRRVQVQWSSTDWKLDPTNRNRSKSNSIEFKSGPSPQKRLGFQSNTSKYKRKTLTTFWRLLKDFWVTPVRSVRFCNLLTLQVSIGTRSTVKCWWNLVTTTRSITNYLKPSSGISKS